jgi:hypothetical protein
MNRVASPRGATAVLLGAALVAWAVTIERMQGMDAGPGTDLGGLGWYLGIWVTMMAAMMLPSAAPAAQFVARAARGLPTTVLFAAGYLAAWTAFGLAAYGLFRRRRHRRGRDLRADAVEGAHAAPLQSSARRR